MNRFTLTLLTILMTSPIFAQIQYPVTEKGNIVDEYFGTKVADPYRWLEDADSPDVKKWIDAENAVTDAYLQKIPFRDKIKKRIEEIWNYPKYSQPQKVGKYYIFSKNDGLQNQSVIYIQDGPDGTPRVLLDPNTFSPDGTIALGGIYPSNDNKYLAYSIQKSGSDWQEYFVIDLASNKKLNDHIEWAKFSGASWYGNGFFYSRYDTPKEGTFTSANEYMKVYYHTIGTPQSEDKLFYEDKDNPKRTLYCGATDDERYILLYIFEAGKKGYMLSVKDTKNPDRGFIPITTDFESKTGIIENDGDILYLMTNVGAPKNRIVKTTISDPSQPNWNELIAESNDVLENVSYVGGKLITTYMKDASNHTYIFDTKGNRLTEVAFPGVGSISGFSGRKNDTEVFYTYTSFTYPPTIYRYDISSGKSTLFRRSEVKFDPDAYESKQIF
jgi:prolyl oligopeptidase